MRLSRPPSLPSPVNTEEGGTCASGRVKAGTNRKIRISAWLDGGKLGHRRERSPQVVRGGRLGAADRDAGQRSAALGMPIEKPRLGRGGDDVRNEEAAGRQAGP